MVERVEYTDLDAALRACGATWNAAQAHGALCASLTLHGDEAAGEWQDLVLDGGSPDAASRGECTGRLEAVFASTRRELAERQSEFAPLLPDDSAPAAVRADALAGWCEGWLHGLVSARPSGEVRARLAAEPLADIVRDMLEITRAAADADARAESNEAAYAELVEYIRVAVQLAYEELAEFRPSHATGSGAGRRHESSRPDRGDR